MYIKIKKFITVALLASGLLYALFSYVLHYVGSANVKALTAEHMVGGNIIVDNLLFDYSSEIEENKCVTEGASAEASGYKVWCWSDLTLGEKAIMSRNPVSRQQIKIDTECNADQVKIENDVLKFQVNPKAAISDTNCERAYNMRAEIRTAPWRVNHPIGTEEWFGWNYTFGEDYQIDKENPWLFFQIHEGTINQTPLIALWCMNNGGPGSSRAGEVHLVNNTYATKSFYHPTGFVPKAGETLRIVVHVVWGDSNSGLIQLWINETKVYDQKERTVRASNPVGGNAKWGIYKWKWAAKERVEKSMAQGIFSLNTSMGPLRIITRKPGDKDYLKPSYSRVMP
ncbi:heparin lyase I family protein [uncultured Zobellia sp.]|uniref:heparin lyase I family protein n=1 Tax=uncultured Zobellia sp. TaxID=255433 RepID=UPI002599BD0F|nr:heparin lyase I family protein [uncultured Zobellia sp.]